MGDRGMMSSAFAHGAAPWRPLVLLAFAVWVLAVGSHHEPWFDEAQAWLMARDNSLWQLLAQRVRYEGTPGLWHAVLWGAIRAGLPYAWFFLIPAALAIAGAAVILWRAPFPPALRVLVLTGYFYGYQFSVVARSYALDLLLMPLAAVLFAGRVERPLRYGFVIGLIANTNAHGFLVAGVLSLELGAQMLRRKAWAGWPGLALATGLCLIALLCAWQPADNNFLQPQDRANPLVTVIVYLCNAFVDHVAVWDPAFANKYDVFASVIGTIVLQIPVVRLVAAGRNRLMALALGGVLLALAAFVHAELWHAGVFFLVWLLVVWVEWDNPLSAAHRRQLVAAMATVLTLQTVQTVRTGLWDIGHVYAPGQQAALAVRAWRADHPHGRIYGYGDYAFIVQPWMAGNVFANYHAGAPNLSYVRWDRREPWMAGAWDMPTRMQFWHTVLAAQPDLIVASAVNRNRTDGHMADLPDEACRAGYAVRAVYPGQMIWRGRPAGDQTLYLFERVGSGANGQPCGLPM
jgi:hypothetical protein